MLVIVLADSFEAPEVVEYPDVVDVPSDDVFENVGDNFFRFSPLSLGSVMLSNACSDGFRKRPPTDARGLSGLEATVLAAGLLIGVLTDVLTGLGDRSAMGESNTGEGSFEELAPDRKFVLLLALSGVFKDLGANDLWGVAVMDC